MPSELSAAAREFLVTRVCTVERLDVLLLLVRQGSKWWNAETVSDAIGMPAEAVQGHLEALSAAGLLDVLVADAVRYIFRPAGRELSDVANEIAQAHYAGRDALLSVLASRRSGSRQLFASAFELRRRKR